jgi:hypothetical protein
MPKSSPDPNCLSVRVHSPDKPKNVQRYEKVQERFERHLGKQTVAWRVDVRHWKGRLPKDVLARSTDRG